MATFERGIEAGLDPQPVTATIGADGTAVTSPASWWNRRICATCGHSFRRGDVVRVDTATRGVVHLAPDLACGAVTEAEDADDAGEPAGRAGSPDAEATEVAEFADGLLAAWPAGEGVPVVRLGAADWRLARPGWQTLGCLYCGHTFRAGEQVVVCPCRPHEAACARAVHRDPAAGLTCWENWRPDGHLEICPVTLTRVRR